MHSSLIAIPTAAVSVTLFAAAAAASAEKCAAPPLNLPYRNVSTAPGILHSGVPIDFGSTWQTVAFTPSLQLDNTFIPRYTNTCLSDDAKTAFSRSKRDSDANLTAANASWTGTNRWIECGDIYGGGYEPSLSRTFRDTRTNSNNQEWWFRTRKYSDWTFITDMFRFDDYLSVYTHTNEALPEKNNATGTFILSNENATFGHLGASLLGLTPDSSLLKLLHGERIIPSTSWALTNASLCLGCINTASSKGDFLIVKPSDRTSNPKLPCLLQTKVEALNWHPRPSVEGASLIQTAFSACIDPGVRFLVLPNDVRGAFQKVLGREVKDEYQDHISFKGPPADDVGLLTVRIAGGLEVNISIVGAGKAGSAGEGGGEWQLPVGRGGWGAYGNETWVLGKPFTDAIVLRWDASNREYGMANVNPEAAAISMNKTKQGLQPLGCEEFPYVEKTVSTTPGTGIIVGATIAGLVAGIVLAMAGLFFFRRGVKGVKKRYEPLNDNISMHTIPHTPGHQHQHHHHQASNVSWASNAGPFSPPLPSVRGSYAGSMNEGLVAKERMEVSTDGAIHEAPEGGTASPTKRHGAEAPG